jgi:ABC-type Zn uptake system ZnuABC Zn-binding protein ZnuA
VKVHTLCAQVGPHDHQASATDAHWATTANLFFVNGLTLDDWFTKVANSSANNQLKTFKIADLAIPEIKRLKSGTETHKHEPGEKHDHGEWDPHAWLGIEQAILMVEKIRDELKTADSKNAGNYDRRAAEYIEKLKKLQDDGKKQLAGKQNRKLVAMHESLKYFCKSFDLDLIGIIMVQPGVEPDANKVAELQDKCEKAKPGIIAIEPQYEKASAQKLADRLSQSKFPIAVVEVDPLETGELQKLGGDYYLRVMEKNLKNLAEKMQ